MTKSIGSPESNFYVISEYPSEDDLKNGFILSGTQGYEFSKWGIPGKAYRTFIFSNKLDKISQAEQDQELETFFSKLRKHKPAIILALGSSVLNYLCPNLGNRKPKTKAKIELEQFNGSLCISDQLDFPHYVIPTLTITDVWQRWDERDIVLSIDIARAKEEYDFFIEHKTLKAIDLYDFLLDPDFSSLVSYLSNLAVQSDIISADIETLMVPKKSESFAKHPGFPYTLALAPSSSEAVSFCFWSYDSLQLCKILKLLQLLFQTKQIIGQNFFSYDLNMLEAFFGFRFDLSKIQDTKLKHHILHPELPHKLQFLCKQYTRQPYYKDEGKGWTPKSKTSLKRLLHYGALDAVVTFRVNEEQDKELKERGLF